MKKKVLFLSPHLDDFALSCADYALSIRDEFDISVCTIFTSFKSTNLPSYSKEYLKNCGCNTVEQFEKMRKKEDREAMKILGLKEYFYLDFIDGGFRNFHKQPIYKTKDSLFSGKISDLDDGIASMLKGKIISICSKYNKIVAPLAIGNHNDHKIVKNILSSIDLDIEKHTFTDFPYASYSKNWNFENLTYVLKNKKQLLLFQSDQKRHAISSYISQVPLLFSKKSIPWFPELILTLK